VTDKADDLEAVRKMVELLAAFEVPDRERIIRWAREKLGMPTQGSGVNDKEQMTGQSQSGQREEPAGAKDIKTFVTEKNPGSDNQFAAAVAYYYRFVAPEAAKKDAITADDLQQACRLTGRNRLPRPSQTLINAHTNGLLDKGSSRGEYTISTVGENLVAVSLPGNPQGGASRSRVRPQKSRPAKPAARGKSKASRKS
jgi:hypothetical protein